MSKSRHVDHHSKPTHHERTHHATPAHPRPANKPHAAAFTHILRRVRGHVQRGADSNPPPEDDTREPPFTATVTDPFLDNPSSGSGSEGGDGQRGGDKDESAASETASEPAGAESDRWIDALIPTSASLLELIDGQGAHRGAVPDAIQSIVQMTSEFCEGQAADEAGEGWQVRLPLREDALPRTVLDLGISSRHLTLRFLCDHEGSRQLLYDHREWLARHLEDALSTRYVISIDIS